MLYPLIATVSNKAYPCFVIDLTGKLIFHRKGISINDYFPSNSQLIANNANYQYPWEMDHSTAMGYIASSINQIKQTTLYKGMNLLYPKGLPQQSQYIYTPQAYAKHSDQKILQLIDSYDKKSKQEKISLVKILESAGVIPIPNLDSYNDKYHRLENGSSGTGKPIMLKAGWLRNGITLRKALVKIT